MVGNRSIELMALRLLIQFWAQEYFFLVVQCCVVVMMVVHVVIMVMVVMCCCEFDADEDSDGE